MMYRDQFLTTIGDGLIWFDTEPVIRLVVTDGNGHRAFRLTRSQAVHLAARLEVAARSIVEEAGGDAVERAEEVSENWHRRRRRPPWASLYPATTTP
ncbi:hypothetical protein [Phenylobacterium sp.]|uniref:hypothetical protein n=1 Tax=Phenylobacterium sp. TaxID=1871053 RepID=UPI00272FF847|nr:hypothetical protein [Phenylobacterium sp.]MDP1873614.1 hypothetical protein [Phenylobacterium sp.]